MDYRKFGECYYIRMDRDDEIISTILEICKKENIKYVGETIFAFGLLFLGIDTMGAVMKPLAASPVFVSMIQQVSGIPVLGVLVGTLMTVVVQSRA